MNAWKVIVATLVIFIAGVVTGGLLVRNTMRVEQLVANGLPAKQARTKPFVILNSPPANPWQARNHELLRRMDRELELTPEQHQEIEKIMAASAERTKSLWKPIAPLMNKETLQARAEIRDQLTPEQRKKFDGFPKPRPVSEKEKHHPPTNAAPLEATNAATVDLLTNAPSEGPR